MQRLPSDPEAIRPSLANLTQLTAPVCLSILARCRTWAAPSAGHSTRQTRTWLSAPPVARRPSGPASSENTGMHGCASVACQWIWIVSTRIVAGAPEPVTVGRGTPTAFPFPSARALATSAHATTRHSGLPAVQLHCLRAPCCSSSRLHAPASLDDAQLQCLCLLLPLLVKVRRVCTPPVRGRLDILSGPKVPAGIVS